MDERKLLIADDSELNRAILVSVLEKNFDILEAADGKEAIATLAAHEGNIAALLLDVVMPEADGFEVLEEMNRRGWIDEIPTIMISVETGGSYIDRAFQLGAADYVSRPFVPNMIRRRVINAILLHTKTRKLTGLIADRFYRRERNTDILAAILGYAVEFRSGERGTHMTNVSRITGLLLHRLLERTDRCPIGPEDIETVCIASSLHDIGKLLIPEGILTKPTALTPDEFGIVKQHTRLGAKIISDLPIYQNETIIKYALEICRWHHERWNGEGYPDGLKGEDIPIAAQVVSLADAYDALTSKRCYKEALSHEKSLEMIRGGECGSFNPLLLECLNDIADTLKHSAGAEAAAEPPAYRWAKELIWKPDDSRQELSSARMTKQVEQELSKRRFFSDLTEEFWFEYTRHPDAVALSAGAARRTGLPRVIVGPLSCTQLCSVMSADTIQAMRDRLLCAASDETYLEFETELTLDGHPSLCQIAVQITWASDEPGRFSSLFGRVLDIGERCRRLEDYRQAFAAPVLHPALLPVTVGADHVLRITGKQVIGVLESCRSMFDTVRLVDPEICMQLTDTSDGAVVKKASTAMPSGTRRSAASTASRRRSSAPAVPRQRSRPWATRCSTSTPYALRWTERPTHSSWSAPSAWKTCAATRTRACSISCFCATGRSTSTRPPMFTTAVTSTTACAIWTVSSRSPCSTWTISSTSTTPMAISPATPQFPARHRPSAPRSAPATSWSATAATSSSCSSTICRGTR